MSYYQWSTDKFIRIFVLTCIMCITLIGNIYIIFKLFFHHHRTRLQLFILNLAIGDLTICFCTMTSELFLLIYDQEWILGNIACKLILYIQVVTLASTTFINVAMTYDRYVAVCCPFRTCQYSARIRFIIILCWLSSCIVATPQLFIFQQSLLNGSLTKYRCASTGYTAEWQRRIYFTTFATYVLVLPAICMIVWYIKIIRIVYTSKKIWTQNINGQTTVLSSTFLTSPTKIKTVKLAMTIIVVFVVCWTPYMLITLIEIYFNNCFHKPSWLDGVLQTICFLQSGLNPFIYMAFNQGRKSSPAIIRAAASTLSQTSDRKNPRQQRGRRGSILFY
ncbi:unnamed protein product [Rotaria sp. Silwood1]|nr:unnamed protein product [Rotaria sp. Silwood1]CAF1317645.1 unnamed protein product [Rotaria sp. Silwood1]CAF1320700.1 unnamed protein product [Rotaria sp. Silwood1]CAF3486907.1 unnamed protein product [Rotaria sp. Silwood1]CAF3566469.1 unnamed protein product [Rotaria sp. Silwood1]